MTTDVTIIIAPNETHRLFNIVGTLAELRDIDTISDAVLNNQPIEFHLKVNPGTPSVSVAYENCVDNDVKLRIVFSATLDLVDLKTLHVAVSQGLHERSVFGNACTDDVAVGAPFTFDLAPGGSGTVDDGGIHIDNDARAIWAVVVSNTKEVLPP